MIRTDALCGASVHYLPINFTDMKKAISGGIVAAISFAFMCWGIRVIGIYDDTVDFLLVFVVLCGFMSLCGLIALFEAVGLTDKIARIFE